MALAQIHGTRQIKAGTISGVSVDSSIIKADGSVSFGGNQSLGGHRLTDLGSPIDINDAVTLNYFQNNSLLPGNGVYSVGTVLHVGGSSSIQVNADDIQISPTYAGQSSITTLGTINNGTWQASPISIQYGGTGQNFVSADGLLRFSGGVASIVTSPNSTIVGISDTQTIYNKTFDISNIAMFLDSNFSLKDNSDPTKALSFELSSIAAGSTVILTAQNLSGTLALNTNRLNFFSQTTSAEFGSVISDRTGNGFLVFSDNPSISGGNITAVNNFSLRDVGNAGNLALSSVSSPALTQNRTLVLDLANASKTFRIGGDLTFSNSFTTSGGHEITFTTSATTSLTLPSTGILVSTARIIKKETLIGTQDGVNAVFTVANTPITGTEELYLNGILLESGVGNDYTISANILTFADAPSTTDKIRISYIY